MSRLIENFQSFFRENAEHWEKLIDYKEAGAQLVLQAFLQRVFNGGGRIHREYALGRGRTDLLIEWPQGGRWDPSLVSQHVLECKALRSGRSLETTIRQGIRQTAGYMDRCKAESGHLPLFDQRRDRSWAERIFRREESADGTPVTVWGM